MRRAGGQWSVEVFPRLLLARTLGLQYVAGGLLAGLWLSLPHTSDRGARGVAAMAVMAVILGVIMLAAAQRSVPVFGYAASRIKKTLTGSG